MITIEVAALILIGILLFELIIFCHEGGHFIAAKLSGVKVNEFALGMGPKILKFTKGETTYSLRLFPIGGFCAMEGEDEKSEDGTYPENVLKNPAGCVGKTEKHKSQQARLFWQAVRMRKYRTK